MTDTLRGVFSGPKERAPAVDPGAQAALAKQEKETDAQEKEQLRKLRARQNAMRGRRGRSLLLFDSVMGVRDGPGTKVGRD